MVSWVLNVVYKPNIKSVKKETSRETNEDIKTEKKRKL